ncbi:unannotated protein [freshwater metagenome]|uniref:Unannotated protein n=1 Tax=freshwater metagenome TaxID=449393 RepID=A0A6J6FNU8_9ZZZZ
MGLRAHVHWERTSEQVVVLAPSGCNLRSERGGCPCVHDIRIAGEPTRHVTLCFGVTRRCVGGGVDGQRGFVSGDGLIVDGRTIGVERIPNRERDAKEALTADEPVTVESVHPVLITNAHVRRMPVKFFTAFKECFTQRKIATAIAQIPLTTGENFERAIALFEELHWVRDGLWFAIELVGLAQQIDDADLGLLDCLAGEFAISSNCALACGHDPFRCFGLDATVDADDRASFELKFAPPDDVGEIAERTNHRDTRTLFRIG